MLLPHEAVGSVEEVDGVLAVGDQVPLEAESLEHLGLGLGPCLGHGHEGIFSNGGHDLLELLDLDLG